MNQIPDIEAVVKDHLAARGIQPVVSETPKDVSTSWVRITQLNARTVGNANADYLQAFYLQIDCYPSVNGPAGLEEASDLKRLVRAELVAMPNAGVAGAAVSAVRFTRDQRLPDPDFKPPRQRWSLDTTVYAHGLRS